ncbi:MAG: PAS domain S-box protein, partial [Actinomycetota bacterium]|nr:PAS domain S-box protein [Actinomycetota bacterium]
TDSSRGLPTKESIPRADRKPPRTTNKGQNLVTVMASPKTPADFGVSALQFVRQLGDSSSNAVVAIDDSGTLLYCNEHAANLFGWTETEMLGQSVGLLIPDRFRRGHAGHVRNFSSDAQSNRHRNPPHRYGLRSDGREFPADITLSRISGDPNPVLFAWVRDISERVAAEEAACERTPPQEHLQWCRDCPLGTRFQRGPPLARQPAGAWSNRYHGLSR